MCQFDELAPEVSKGVTAWKVCTVVEGENVLRSLYRPQGRCAQDWEPVWLRGGMLSQRPVYGTDLTYQEGATVEGGKCGVYCYTSRERAVTIANGEHYGNDGLNHRPVAVVEVQVPEGAWMVRSEWGDTARVERVVVGARIDWATEYANLT